MLYFGGMSARGVVFSNSPFENTFVSSLASLLFPAQIVFLLYTSRKHSTATCVQSSLLSRRTCQLRWEWTPTKAKYSEASCHANSSRSSAIGQLLQKAIPTSAEIPVGKANSGALQLVLEHAMITPGVILAARMEVCGTSSWLPSCVN